MTITTKLDFKSGAFTNPHYTSEGECVTSIFSLNYDLLCRHLHNDNTPTTFFPEIKPTNIIQFQTIQNGQNCIELSIVLSVDDDNITISYATSMEEAVSNG